MPGHRVREPARSPPLLVFLGRGISQSLPWLDFPTLLPPNLSRARRSAHAPSRSPTAPKPRTPRILMNTQGCPQSRRAFAEQQDTGQPGAPGGPAPAAGPQAALERNTVKASFSGRGDCHHRFILSLASGYSHCFPVISHIISPSTILPVSWLGEGRPERSKRRKTGGATERARRLHCGW